MAETLRNDLSPADRKALKNQTINEKKPGSILAGFNIFDSSIRAGSN
jgi:hypothetical protein